MSIINPAEPEQAEDELKSTLIDSGISAIPVVGSIYNIFKSASSIFKMFGGKLIYGRTKAEFERAFLDNSLEAWGHMRHLVNLAMNPSGGSGLFTENPEILKGLSVGDYIYARFGFRYGAAEPNMNPVGYYIEFDPDDLLKPVAGALRFSGTPEKLRLLKEKDFEFIKKNWVDYNPTLYTDDGKLVRYPVYENVATTTNTVLSNIKVGALADIPIVAVIIGVSLLGLIFMMKGK